MQLTDPRYYDKKTPRSIRLNNSGAMEYGNFAKKYGAMGSDGRYAIFPTEGPNAYGVRAHGALLDSYGKRGINTLSAITQRWAPRNRLDPNNVPANYAAHVGRLAGIDPNAPITREMYPQVIHAMSRHEAGRNPNFTLDQARALLGGGALPASSPPPATPTTGAPAPMARQTAGAGMAGFDISGISPEQAATLAKMGMASSGRAPQNVGEGLHYIGEKINQAAWQNQLLQAMRKGNAESNAAWASVAGGGMAAPMPQAPAQQPAPVTPAASNMAAMGSFRGAQEAGMGAGMAGGPQMEQPSPAAPATQPAVGAGMADPRLGQIDAELARVRSAVANPATRQFALQRMQELEKQKFALNDPKRQIEMELLRAQTDLARAKAQRPAGGAGTSEDFAKREAELRRYGVEPSSPEGQMYLFNKKLPSKLYDNEAQLAKRQAAAPNIASGLTNLRGMAEQYDTESFENALGPLQGSTPDSLLGAAVVNTARLFGEAANYVNGGGTTPNEVRSNIQGSTEALAAAIKPLIRGPGEGVWTDADQARLVSIVGDLAQSSTKDEFRRRLNAVRDRIKSNFGLEVPFDAFEAGKSSGGNVGRFSPGQRRRFNIQTGEIE